MTSNGGRAENRYRSRTLWLVVGLSITATALLGFDKVEAGHWVTVVLALFAGWQARRYGDNRLSAGNGGGK